MPKMQKPRITYKDLSAVLGKKGQFLCSMITEAGKRLTALS